MILVHGCFWHQHDCPLGRKKPSANPDYWHPKLARNVARDCRSQDRLRALGWDVLVIWECETKNPLLLAERIRAYLGSVRSPPEKQAAAQDLRRRSRQLGGGSFS